MKKIITVDFDMTLAYEQVENTGWLCVGSGKLYPIAPVVQFITDKHREGFEIHIVTFREDKDIPEVHSFIKIHGLPIKQVHNTSSKSKTPVLKKLGSSLHLDDSLSVCIAAKMEGIDTIFIDYGQPLDASQQELVCNLNKFDIELP